ncbi:MAG: hypothetical protein HXX11_19845 [Desulfuromonadales bacterium]|nr:hypothetical protein [Desulfuromonadales bacterium]
MVKKAAISLLCCTLLFSIPFFEKAVQAADVETVGDLKVTGIIDNTGGEGIRFTDNSLQTTAYTGSASGGVNITSPDGSISVGGTPLSPTVSVTQCLHSGSQVLCR